MRSHAPDLTATDIPSGSPPPTQPTGSPWLRVFIIAVGVLMLALAGALVVVLTTAKPRAPQSRQAPTGSLSTARPLGGQAGFIGAPVAINPEIDDMTVYAGSVWVTSWKAGEVLRVNERTRTVTGVAADFPLRIEPGLGSLWIASDGLELTRLSAADDKTTTIAHADFGDKASLIAVGNRHVWVAAADHRKAEVIDPTTNRISGTVDLGGDLVDLTWGGGLLFAQHTDGTISVIDETTDRTVRKLAVTGTPDGLEYDSGVLYVARRDSVLPMDPRSGKPGALVRIGSGWDYVEVEGGRVWVAYDKRRLVRQFDGRTGREIGSSLATPATPRVVNIGDTGNVWVACTGGALYELTPNGGSRVAPRVTAPTTQSQPRAPATPRTTSPGTASPGVTTPGTTTPGTTTPGATTPGGTSPAPTFSQRIHIVTWWSPNYFSYEYEYAHFKAVDKDGRTVKEVLGSDSVRLDDALNGLPQTPELRKLVDHLRASLVSAGWTEIGLRPGGDWYEYEFGR